MENRPIIYIENKNLALSPILVVQHWMVNTSYPTPFIFCLKWGVICKTVQHGAMMHFYYLCRSGWFRSCSIDSVGHNTPYSSISVHSLFYSFCCCFQGEKSPCAQIYVCCLDETITIVFIAITPVWMSQIPPVVPLLVEFAYLAMFAVFPCWPTLLAVWVSWKINNIDK